MPHFQQAVNKWLEAVGYLPDGFLIKAVDQVQMLPGAIRLEAMGQPDSSESLEDIRPLSDEEMAERRHAWLEALPEKKTGAMESGNVTTVLRHWYDNNYAFGGTYEENKQRARLFYDSFIDPTFMQHAHKVDFVEELNEYLASSHTGHELQDRLTWAKAAADIWKNEYRTRPGLQHIRLILVNAPVGNDIALGFAQIASQFGCAIGYHGYDFWVNGQRDPGSWRWYAGRWNWMDAEYRAAGYTVQWAFTEVGPYSSAVDGWKHPNVHNGNIEAYKQSVKWFVDQCKTTHAYQTGRILGFHLFTSGGGSQWGRFETQGDDLVKVCQVIGANWNSVPVPPPDPDPDPDPDPPTGDNILRNADFEGGWFDQPTGQVPNEWQFEYYTGQSPYDPASYVKPETRVILKAQLPPGEWEQFGLSGEQAVKAFKGSLPWHGSYIQNLSQPLTKNGKATIKFFADLVLSYGPKTYARYDPDNPAGQIRVNGGDWQLVIPGEINTFDFNLPAGTGQLKIEWRCNYPLANNGIFFDDPILTEVETMPDRTWKKKVYLLDPEATPAQYAALQAIAYQTKSEIAFSADSAFDRPSRVTERHEVIVYGWGGAANLEPWIELYYKFSPATIRSYKPLSDLGATPGPF